MCLPREKEKLFDIIESKLGELHEPIALRFWLTIAKGSLNDEQFTYLKDLAAVRMLSVLKETIQ